MVLATFTYNYYAVNTECKGMHNYTDQYYKISKCRPTQQYGYMFSHEQHKVKGEHTM